MYQELERPITEQERQRLFALMPLAQSPFRPFRKYRYGLEIIGEIVGATLGAAVFIEAGKWDAFHVILITLGFLMLWWLLHLKTRVLIPLRSWRETNKKAWQFHNAIKEAQTIHVYRIESSAVVEVMHDEGTICLFNIGDNRTYWIDPSCMVSNRSKKDWPNSKFEVIKISKWEEEIGPFCDGKRLQPQQTVEFRDLFENYEFQPPADGIINQSLDAFLKDCRNRNGN